MKAHISPLYRDQQGKVFVCRLLSRSRTDVARYPGKTSWVDKEENPAWAFPQREEKYSSVLNTQLFLPIYQPVSQ